jgi:tetratricopeptide (TPR) repeat protein
VKRSGRRLEGSATLARLATLAAIAVAAPAMGATTPGAASPAPERTVQVAAPAKSVQTARTRKAPARPAFRGTRLPPELEARLRAQLDARVERDLAEMRKLRGEALGLLRTFVAESPKETREMPEALLRLGELEWETAREGYLERFKAWEATPAHKRGPTPQPDFAPARDCFGRVLRDYPNFVDYDLALYVDGFLASEQGREDEAVQRFDRILAEFPRSRFVPDAHMARAEWLFATKSDYTAALAEYQAVLAYRQSELYGLALFKSAWCLWRLGRNEDAVRRFVSVFEVTDAEGRAVDGQRRRGGDAQRRKALDELQSEALKYLVEVFTEDDRNSAGDMFRFLQKIGGDRFAGRIVKALATTFYEQAHYERGIEAYELLLRLDPTNPEAAGWALEIASGYAAVEDYPNLKKAWERALTGYTAGSAWARSQADPDVVAQATARMESTLRAQALELHAKAQRDKSRTEYEGALGLYEAYLGRFAKDPSAYQVQFYAAEVCFYHLDRPEQAASLYMAAARGAPAESVDPKSPRHDALYNALVALERARTAELAGGKTTKAGQETETDKRFAEALELYAQLYPKDPALPELFYRQGKLYYDHGVYDAAVRIWGALLERFPQSEQAGPAGELLLDSFNRAKNYENIEAWGRRLKGVPAFQSPKQQERLDALVVQAVFKQGEQHMAQGDALRAAQAYLRAAREFPRDARAAQACANAAVAAQKAGDLASLKAAGQIALSKDVRDRPEAPQAAWVAATSLQAMGLFAEAAEFDEALASEKPDARKKNEHGRDAAFNAVVLRVATGENDRAIIDGERYLSAYGKSAEADEVYFLMGKAHQNAGRQKEAAALYKKFLAGRATSLDKRVQGEVLLAQALAKTGDEKGAQAALAQAVTWGRKRRGDLGATGKYAAAQARYLEGERILAQFEAVRIEGDVQRLRARLKQKSELLKKAATVFLDVVSMGVAEWTTAALYQIGRTYELFAKTLREAPAPQGLSDADKEAYTQQIEEFVVPIEERSLDAYENGWKKAVDLGIYNQWTAKMREALGRLNGELYPPLREVGFEVRSAAAMPLPPLMDAPRRGVGPAPTNAGASPPASGPASGPAPGPASGKAKS